MRLAFFGGTFDPPHCGHMAIARAAIARLGLDQVWMAPAGVQPLKRGVAHTPFADRLEMVRLACEGQERMAATAIDRPRADGRANYTYDTLLRVREGLSGGDRLFLLIGADSFEMLGKWHRAKDLFALCTMVVAARPGAALESVCAGLPVGIDCVEKNVTRDWREYALHGGVPGGTCLYVLPDLQYDVSATAIREALVAGDASAWTGLVADSVAAYAREHGLYRTRVGIGAVGSWRGAGSAG